MNSTWLGSILLWSLAGYLCGSIPFAVLIGRLAVKVDPRTVGDGNPGGTNVWKAGGWKIGLVTAIVEILKGYPAVYLAQRAGITEWALVPVALSPILGHGTQPFLGWRGGKALGTTGGSWMAIIGLWVFPIYALGAVPALVLQKQNAYAAIAGMLALVGYAILFDGSSWLVGFSVLNTMLILWTHRRELGSAWEWRGWLAHATGRGEA